MALEIRAIIGRIMWSERKFFKFKNARECYVAHRKFNVKHQKHTLMTCTRTNLIESPHFTYIFIHFFAPLIQRSRTIRMHQPPRKAVLPYVCLFAAFNVHFAVHVRPVVDCGSGSAYPYPSSAHYDLFFFLSFIFAPRHVY